MTTIDQGRATGLRAGAALRRPDARRATSAATSTPGSRRPTCASTRPYRFAANHHNPIETLGHDRGLGRRPADALRLDAGHHAPTQLTVAAAARACRRRRSGWSTHFVGGGFGCKAMVWPHVTLAAMAARHVGRPVRLALTRAADVHLLRAPRGAGAAHRARRDARRPAHRDPAPQALGHLAVRRLGRAGHRRRPRSCTRCPNYRGRAPAGPRQHDDADVHPRARARRSACSRSRCAMDELAVRARASTRSSCGCATTPTIDPAAATRGRATGCAECLRRGAERFGWAGRDPRAAVRARRQLADRHRDGRRRLPGRVLHADAARAGAHVRRRQRRRADRHPGVRHRRRDRDDPGRRRRARRRAGRRCGSRSATPTCPTAASAVGSDGRDDGQRRRAQRRHRAARPARSRWPSPTRSRRCTAPTRAAVAVGDGRMMLARRARHRRDLRRPAAAQPHDRRRGDRQLDAAAAGHPARAADLRRPVRRGRRRRRPRPRPGAPAWSARSPPAGSSTRKTARSQLMGGMLWGMGQALLEGNRMDPRTGRWASASLGEYLVPVNADAPDVDVEFVEVDDDVVNPLGRQGRRRDRAGRGRGRDRQRRLPRHRPPRPRAAASPPSWCMDPVARCDA